MAKTPPQPEAKFRHMITFTVVLEAREKKVGDLINLVPILLPGHKQALCVGGHNFLVFNILRIRTGCP